MHGSEGRQLALSAPGDAAAGVGAGGIAAAGVGAGGVAAVGVGVARGLPSMPRYHISISVLRGALSIVSMNSLLPIHPHSLFASVARCLLIPQTDVVGHAISESRYV